MSVLCVILFNEGIYCKMILSNGGELFSHDQHTFTNLFYVVKLIYLGYICYYNIFITYIIFNLNFPASSSVNSLFVYFMY